MPFYARQIAWQRFQQIQDLSRKLALTTLTGPHPHEFSDLPGSSTPVAPNIHDFLPGRDDSFIRQILNSNPDCVEILSPTGNLLSLSAEGRKALEVSSENDLVGRWWPERWPVASRTLAETAISKALEGRDSCFQAPCPTAKGTPKWWDVRVTPIISKTGTPEWIVSITRDITDQKAAEATIEHTRNRLDLALRGAHIGTFSWDFQTQIRTWDEHCAPLFGLPRQAMSPTAEMHSRLIHPDDRSYVQNRLADALTSGQYKAEYRVIWPDGSVHMISAWGEVSFVNDQATQMTGVAWDITARKQAEEVARSNESKLKEAAEIAQLGHWEFEPATNKLNWSEETLRIFGLPSDRKIRYDEFLSMLPVQDRERVRAAIQSKQAFELAHRISRADGSIRHADVRGRVEYATDGSVKAVVGTILDVTLHVEARLALKRATEQLELRVEERTGATCSQLQGSSRLQ